MIDYADFEKVEIHLGTVREAVPFTEARHPAYKVHIDFGPKIGTRWSSAQITDLYKPEDLIDRQVFAVTNLKPKRVAGFKSECLILGVYCDDGAVVLAAPDRSAANGSRLL